MHPAPSKRGRDLVGMTNLSVFKQALREIEGRALQVINGCGLNER